jgi:hypothetical protein
MARGIILFVISLLLISSLGLSSASQMGREYSVTFDETGLPAGYSWYVSFANLSSSTTNSSITFQITNGSYYYFVGSISGINVSPQHGIMTVDGSNVTENVTFSPVYYKVTFNETGLPAGSYWSVNFTGKSVNVNTNSTSFEVPQGEYTFSVKSADPTFTPSPSSGIVYVTSYNITENILFSQKEYVITFAEVGLQYGTSWSVNLSGEIRNSSSGQIYFSLPNGSYSYTVPPVPGYNSSVSSGNISVKGRAQSIPVLFLSTIPYTFVVQGIPQGDHWTLRIGANTYISNSSVITVYLPNDTYNYEIFLPNGFSGGNLKGTVTYSNSFIIVNALDMVLVYVAIIVLIIIVDCFLVFYVLRRRRRGAPKQ